MASRNERKRRAAEKRRVLEQAVKEAFALEAEKQRPTIEREKRLAAYPEHSGLSFHLKRGQGNPVDGDKVRSDKPYPKPAMFLEPLKGDGHNGKGELRRRYIR